MLEDLQRSPKGLPRCLGLCSCLENPSARPHASQREMRSEGEKKGQTQGHGWEDSEGGWGVGMEDREGQLASGPGKITSLGSF